MYKCRGSNRYNPFQSITIPTPTHSRRKSENDSAKQRKWSSRSRRRMTTLKDATGYRHRSVCWRTTRLQSKKRRRNGLGRNGSLLLKNGTNVENWTSTSFPSLLKGLDHAQPRYRVLKHRLRHHPRTRLALYVLEYWKILRVGQIRSIDHEQRRAKIVASCSRIKTLGHTVSFIYPAVLFTM